MRLSRGNIHVLILRNLRPDSVLLLVLLAASLGLNVFQGVRFAGHTHSFGPQTTPPMPPLASGATAPPMSVQTLDGRQVRITYGEAARPTVLYVFKPSCAWCERNLQNLRHLVSERSDKFQFIGLSLEPDGLISYVRDSGLNFPVYLRPTDETIKEYRLGNVPHTLVMSETGVVLKNWAGAYGTIGPDVEAFFRIKLPGL
jgi:peroxiredoxin